MPVKAKAAPTKKKAATTKTPKATAKKPVKAKAAAAAPKKKVAPKATTKQTKPAAPKKTAAKKATVKKAAPVKKASPVKKAAAPKKVAPKKAAPKKVAPKAKVTKPSGIPEQLLDAALKVLDERKAEDIVQVDLRGRSAIADYAIVASGGSARMLGAIAEYLREAFFKLGVRKLRIEGLPQGDWVLIDAGDVLIHLFRPEVRSFYHIEDIWSGKQPSA